MAYTPCGLLVPGPKTTPNRYGLLTVAEPVTPEDGHWEGGITWDDNLCSSVHSTTEYCPIPVSGFAPKIADRDFQSCCADPFIVYASYDCPPVGKPAGEAFEVAQKRLSIREEQEVERVFWTGIAEDGIEVNPSLAFGNSECGSAPVDLTGSGGPVGIVASMAVLESALGECAPGTGVIHANYGIASFLASTFLITQRDDAWFTVTGQRLAIGAGYPGSGPDNIAATAGTTWLFATGPVVIYRSEVFLTPERFKEAMNAKINSVQVYAERVYSVGWSCCLFAIQVTLCP
jgi:hypothetical protein